MKTISLFISIGLFAVLQCCTNGTEARLKEEIKPLAIKDSLIKLNKAGVRTIHVFVALCDNKYQGIVPVGKNIGNGQDAENNLYWGAAYGVKAYFKKKSSDWILLESNKNLSSHILERLLFKHKYRNVYLLADAYDGQFIKQTTIDFLNASAGNNGSEKIYKGETLYFGGASNLVTYTGHDGLMDFALPLQDASKAGSKREAIILACYSKKYFSPHLKRTGALPLIWTTGLMAPEAYILHDALKEWVLNKSNIEIQLASSKAYSKYQKCSLKAAKNLLVSGW